MPFKLGPGSVFAKGGLNLSGSKMVGFFKGGNLQFNAVMRDDVLYSLVNSIADNVYNSPALHGMIEHPINLSGERGSVILPGLTHGKYTFLGDPSANIKIPTVPIPLRILGDMYGVDNIKGLLAAYREDPTQFLNSKYTLQKNYTSSSYNPEYVYDTSSEKFVTLKSVADVNSVTNQLPNVLPFLDSYRTIRKRHFAKKAIEQALANNKEPDKKDLDFVFDYSSRNVKSTTDPQGDIANFYNERSLYYNLSFVFIIFDESRFLRTKLNVIPFVDKEVDLSMNKKSLSSSYKGLDKLVSSELGQELSTRVAKRSVFTVFVFSKESDKSFINSVISEYSYSCSDLFKHTKVDAIIDFDKLDKSSAYSHIPKGNLAFSANNEVFNLDTYLKNTTKQADLDEQARDRFHPDYLTQFLRKQEIYKAIAKELGLKSYNLDDHSDISNGS